jgi:hypothetical protein
LRDIASRFAVARLVTAGAVLATVAVAATQAGAATPAQPPTITSSWTPNQIGVTQSSGVTYTITNPNASGTLYQVSFADDLPAGTAVDNPASPTVSGCGSSDAVTANPGAGTISAAGIQVKAGTPCTIAVSVVGNGAGTGSDAYTAALYTSSSASYAIPGAIPAADLKPAALQVLGAPTVTVKTPKNNAVYSYGQVVKASYSCQAAAGDDPTQLQCLATDDLGNNINNGGKLDTKVAGKHQLEISAISGLTADETDVTVNYTVLPDNLFTVSKLKVHGGEVSFSVKVPGAGKVAVAELAGKTTLRHGSFTVRGKKTVPVTFLPESGAVSIVVSFTPKGGQKHTVTEHVTI